MNEPLFEVGTQANGVRFCFPVGFDRSDLVEVTCVGDAWCKYVNESTGAFVDCAEFAAQMSQP